MKTPHSQSFARYVVALTFVLATVVGGCLAHTSRHEDVYVGYSQGGGPVHGAVHGVQCINRAATSRGCD